MLQAWTWTIRTALVLVVVMVSSRCLAAKGSGMVYEDPFDRGAGGASLTRAAQGGMLLANPALIPYGEGFHRWVGVEPTLIVGKDSVDFAKSMKSGGGDMDASTLVDTVMKTPIHIGASNALSYINKGFGLTVFDHFESDLQAKKYGDLGLPAVNFQAESYHGAAASFASLLGGRGLSFGMTAKYLYAAEPNVVVELTDQDGLKSLTSPAGMKSFVTHNTGVGADAGLLLFKQGYNLDFRMALKVDDIGDTMLQGDGNLKTLPQMYSAGIATTFHTGVDALHLALDYRDIQGAYGEKTFKRVRAGTKLMLRRYVGFGIGLYDGWPSYAAELDLILMRITASTWTKEMGSSPGLNPRTVYAVGLAMGF